MALFFRIIGLPDFVTENHTCIDDSRQVGLDFMVLFLP